MIGSGHCSLAFFVSQIKEADAQATENFRQPLQVFSEEKTIVADDLTEFASGRNVEVDQIGRTAK